MKTDGYQEITLWNNHVLQIWSEGRLAILRHPLGCSSEDDGCRERLMKYIHNEGIFDHLLDKRLLVLDSYAELDP